VFHSISHLYVRYLAELDFLKDGFEVISLTGLALSRFDLVGHFLALMIHS
jgi:hypothetical protein